MSGPDCYLKRLVERIRELRQQHQDDATFFVETSKALLSVARNDHERGEAEALIKEMKTLRRFGVFKKPDNNDDPQGTAA